MAKQLNFTKLQTFNVLALCSTYSLNLVSEILKEEGSCSVSKGYIYTKGIPNNGEYRPIVFLEIVWWPMRRKKKEPMTVERVHFK